MVGRMFREAVENLIDDVKESIEEQGRPSGPGRRFEPPPMPHVDQRLNLELPPNLELSQSAPEPPVSSQPDSPSEVLIAAAPVVPARERSPAPVVPARERSLAPVAPSRERSLAPVAPSREPSPAAIETAVTPAPDDVEPGGRGPDEPTGESATPSAASKRAETSLARLEAEVDAARELYRDTRAELREARRIARLAARDERRDRRYERRLQSEADELN